MDDAKPGTVCCFVDIPMYAGPVFVGNKTVSLDYISLSQFRNFEELEQYIKYGLDLDGEIKFEYVNAEPFSG